MILLVDHIQVIHDTFSADHGQTDSFVEVFDSKDLNRTDLACVGNVCSTACTEVGTRETHETHLSCQFFFASVRKFLQFFFRWIKDLYRSIFPDFLVCLCLDLSKLCLGENAAQIHCDHITAHMESYIIISVCFMHQTADDMFTGMLLHQVKSSLPVDLSSYFTSDLQSHLCMMNNLAVFFLDICHCDLIQCSKITRLSTALRIKSGLIQNDLIALTGFSALENFCGKFFYIYIFVIQFSCFTHAAEPSFCKFKSVKNLFFCPLV